MEVTSLLRKVVSRLQMSPLQLASPKTSEKVLDKVRSLT